MPRCLLNTQSQDACILCLCCFSIQVLELPSYGRGWPGPLCPTFASQSTKVSNKLTLLLTLGKTVVNSRVLTLSTGSLVTNSNVSELVNEETQSWASDGYVSAVN
jgi:hypothetical protein